MERRVRGNSHARCEAGENLEIASKSYLSLYSWVIHIRPRKNQVIETTVGRVAYFGFAMTPEEANQFYFDNE
jgi:hypothetical protein